MYHKSKPYVKEFTFSFFLVYNYNGDGMKSNTSLMCNIKNNDDLNSIDKLTKYLVIDVINSSNDVFSFLIEHGQNYFYAELIDDLKGFFFVNYNTFIKGEYQIKKIIEGLNSEFNDLEKLRYIYINLGKYLTNDINSLEYKNDKFSFNDVGVISNMWGSLAMGKANSLSASKIVKYICHLVGLDCKIVFNNKMFYNEITIGGQSILINLFLDIPYIQFGFPTVYFSTYNDDNQLDKKIGYINKKYNSSLLDKTFKKMLFSENFSIEHILDALEKNININMVGSLELYQMLNMIFSRYYPNENISVNNLYINCEDGKRQHFVLISSNDKYYSYNYESNKFIMLDKKDLMDSFNIGKIGVYLEESLPSLNIYSSTI